MQTKKINIKLNLELIPINTVKLILFYKITLKKYSGQNKYLIF